MLLWPAHTALAAPVCGTHGAARAEHAEHTELFLQNTRHWSRGTYAEPWHLIVDGCRNALLSTIPASNWFLQWKQWWGKIETYKWNIINYWSDYQWNCAIEKCWYWMIIKFLHDSRLNKFSAVFETLFKIIKCDNFAIKWSLRLKINQLTNQSSHFLIKRKNLSLSDRTQNNIPLAYFSLRFPLNVRVKFILGKSRIIKESLDWAGFLFSFILHINGKDRQPGDFQYNCWLHCSKWTTIPVLKATIRK